MPMHHFVNIRGAGVMSGEFCPGRLCPGGFCLFYAYPENVFGDFLLGIRPYVRGLCLWGFCQINLS